MTSQQLWIASLCLGTLGIGLWAATLALRLWRSARTSSQVRRLLQARQASAAHSAAATAGRTPLGGIPLGGNPLGGSPLGGTPLGGKPPGTATGDAQLLHPQAASIRASDSPQALSAQLQPPAWLQSGVGQALLAEEDRKLLDQAGIAQRSGSMLYVGCRLALAGALPLLALGLLQPKGLYASVLYAFFGLGLGLMLPKWVVRAKASRRREQVVEELPLFVDLLRLLQGVGLSIDQSLQILAAEFGSVLRVISGELALANQLYSSGRSREQSFQRLANLSADDDMTAIVNLLTQVDRHGGAVQEPLREFSVRLREKRQASFKEKIGAITVKMTAVMVLSLLPALLVITAGPGFMAVIRALSNAGGH